MTQEPTHEHDSNLVASLVVARPDVDGLHEVGRLDGRV